MASLWSMRHGKTTTALALVLVALLGTRYLTASAGKKAVAFDDLASFKAFAEEQGCCFHCGNGSGWYGDNLFVGDRPLSLPDLEPVQWKHGCGESPAWKGILWVSRCGLESADGDFFGGGRLPTVTVTGHWRVWGKVLVAGDPEMLDRLENSFLGR